ncbi:ATP-dependent helicase [Microbacterium amylolyticum]|uniref:DNA 3'-5' helicase n=1 Tax=Microbacterium amylolyticum TaxID=936337 RepID=A0ABS4ZMU5_9MICO|nr:ATP-dependent DNA helicase [Microbacterium amylolyticum]MBP2437776.1 superfamily I DNA/RNA helicase [Microbacterium amylolyticum]
MAHTSPENVAWDPEQKRVIDADPTQSAVVVGAAGSGKTSVITARTSRLIGGDAPQLSPEELMVLTPSRVSATRLRDHLGLAAGVATPGPLARSVGALAFHIVRSDAAARGEDAPQLLTGADQDRILAHIIEGDIADGRITWPAHLSVDVRRTRDFRSELRAFLDSAIELDVSSEELSALSGGEWSPVAQLLSEYADVVSQMRTSSRDAAELISEAERILRTRETVAGIDRLRTIMIDDAQELTRGGIALVRALRGRGVAVMAFGDPDIASGAFRGITPDLFSGLARDLGQMIVLTGQHRAGDELSWLSRSVTQSIGASAMVQHRLAPGPAPEQPTSLSVVRAASPHDEIDAIAWRLREWHLTGGVPWNDMAIIAHDTRQLVMLENELAAREVPTRAAGVARPLGTEPAVRQIVELVRLGTTPPEQWDDEALDRALRSSYGGFDGVALRRLRARLRHAEMATGGARPARELVREGFFHPVQFGLLDTPEGRSAERLATTLSGLGDMTREGATIHDLLWHAWDRARTIDGRRLSSHWHRLATSSGPLAAEATRALDGLVALFQAAKRSIERNPEQGPGPFIREILDSDVPEDTLSAPERAASVTLLTPANALATEFDAVVIAGLQDGVWPNLRPRGGLLGTWRLAEAVHALREGRVETETPPLIDRRREALHDELRLFVRAISRARARLLVTAVDDESSTPSPLFGFLPAAAASPHEDHPLTLRGLVAHHRRTLTTTDDLAQREHAAGQLRLLADAGVPGADPESWYGQRPPTTTAPLRDIEAGPVRISPSRIETFEECGLQWAISSLGGDTVTSPSAGLGTILHAALERVPDGGADELRRVVEERWGELDFETPWIARKERRRLDQYISRLDYYLSSVRSEGGRVIASEAPFRFAVAFDDGSVHTGDSIEAPRRAIVRGVIDRVEGYRRGGGDHMEARGTRPAPEPIAPLDDDATEAVVVADLKSGKFEQRTTDPSVASDAQLATYQIAVQEGLVPGADPGGMAGARLLVVSQTTSKSPYRVAHQHPLQGPSRDEFLARVVEAGRGMAASSFTAAVESHCEGARFAPVCRIHTIKAVSS